ncbi:MAG: hypothetical protein ACJ8GK_09065 [Luteimonas sp.]
MTKRASSATPGQGTRSSTGASARKSTGGRTAGKSTTKQGATAKSAAKTANASSSRPAGSKKAAGSSVRKSTGDSVGRQRAAAPARTSGGGGESPGTSRARKQSTGRGNGESSGITPEKALDNTRSLLAAKKSRDRQPPAWQEPGLPPSNDAKASDGSDGAGDRARELHHAEMGLKAIEADVAGRDKRKQGKRDSR